MYLVDPELYGSPASQQPEQRSGIATDTIDTQLRNYVIPMVPQLLKDEDPMPLYALKVRATIQPCWGGGRREGGGG